MHTCIYIANLEGGKRAGGSIHYPTLLSVEMANNTLAIGISICIVDLNTLT